jgi:hypothetical protein
MKKEVDKNVRGKFLNEACERYLSDNMLSSDSFLLACLRAASILLTAPRANAATDVSKGRETF